MEPLNSNFQASRYDILTKNRQSMISLKHPLPIYLPNYSINGRLKLKWLLSLRSWDTLKGTPKLQFSSFKL